MRLHLWLGLLAWQITVPVALIAQDATGATRIDDAASRELPDSLKKLPANTAFFFAVHHGSDFLTMISGSDFVRELQSAGADELLREELPTALAGNEINLGGIEIDFDEAAEQTLHSVAEHKDDLYAVVSQLFRNDAILLGDETWSTNWESISKLIPVAKQRFSLKEKDDDPNSFDLEGTDWLFQDQSFGKLRLPNTLLSFQLTDTAPAQRLLKLATNESEKRRDKELGGWIFSRHDIGDDALVVFSYPLDIWLENVDGQNELTEKERTQRRQLREFLRARKFHFAMGLVQSRLVFFVGEELSSISEMLGMNTQPATSLPKETHLRGVLPKQDETLIVSAFVSDRYAKSTDSLDKDGLLTSFASLARGLSGTVKVDDVPLDEAVMAMGVPLETAELLGEKLVSIGQRWDALAAPSAGWAATICASRSGITGRSVTHSIAPEYPTTPLSIDQHVGPNAIAFYARQGTTTSQRVLLGYDFFSHAYLGFSELMLGIAGEEEFNDDARRHLRRLKQMPLRLTAIVNDQLLPAVGDNGQAFVMTRFDATPSIANDAPFEFSLVSSVANRADVINAGEMLRRWANSFVNQITQVSAAMDESDATPFFHFDSPLVADDGDSDLFTLEMFINSDSTTPDEAIEDNADGNASEEITTLDLLSVQTMFHWRLSDHVLAMGTSPSVTKGMLSPRQPISAERGLEPIKGVVRTVAWIDAEQIAKLPKRGPGDQEEIKQFQKVVRCIDSFHQVTTTHNGETIRRWKLSMPLGNP